MWITTPTKLLCKLIAKRLLAHLGLQARSCYSQVSKVTRRGCGEWLGAVAQSSKGLVTMISADGAVSCGLVISLVLDCDSPGNTTNLLWEDVHTLRGDAAVTLVPAALLLLV